MDTADIELATAQAIAEKVLERPNADLIENYE